MNMIKQVVDSLVAAGTPLADIIKQVNVAAVVLPWSGSRNS